MLIEIRVLSKQTRTQRTFSERSFDCWKFNALIFYSQFFSLILYFSLPHSHLCFIIAHTNPLFLFLILNLVDPLTHLCFIRYVSGTRCFTNLHTHITHSSPHWNNCNSSQSLSQSVTLSYLSHYLFVSLLHITHTQLSLSLCHSLTRSFSLSFHPVFDALTFSQCWKSFPDKIWLWRTENKKVKF